MNYSAQEIAIASGGILHQNGEAGNFQFDTRIIEKGQWFLALKGSRDGHDFIPLAKEKGAVGVLGQAVPDGWDRGFVEVEDTLIGFQNIARWTRNNYSQPVIGITGSAGKTTTRALISCVLSERGRVHQTAGNFNNHIGLPKTITDAPKEATSWVLEMGMSALGEIDLLQEIANPTIRIITNIGSAHIEGCGSIEGVAQAKGELFAGAKKGQTCCVNMDDPLVSARPIPDDVNIIRYGSNDECDVQLISYEIQNWNTVVTIKTKNTIFSATIPVPGAFMALNACAATAVGLAAGLSETEIAAGLAKYQPVGNRMKIQHVNDICFINDSYNANPLSMRASLQALSAMDSLHKIAVLGDMLEMGQDEESSHIEILKFAASLHLPTAIVGSRFQQAYQMLSDGEKENIIHQTKTSIEMAQALTEDSRFQLILLKGSRGIRMENIVHHFQDNLVKKKIAILGMGRSGRSAAKLALSLGKEVHCIDGNPNCEILESCFFHTAQPDNFDSFEELVISPGVPATHPIVQYAQEHNISVVGELGFAARHIKVPLLAITGTNGKSSTAWYTYQLLQQTHHKPFIGGNFGIALSELALAQPDYTVGVVEVSSYQMEFPDQFHPKAAAILNLTPDHLARHKTMAVYQEMKQRIFAQQNNNDLSIIPSTNPEFAKNSQGKTVYYDNFPGIKRTNDHFTLKLNTVNKNISLTNLKIIGSHNLDNLAAAILLLQSLEDVHIEDLDFSLLSALEHRLEVVTTDDNLTWINDSKATNIEATQAALQSLAGPIILFLGGAGKDGADYTQLKELLNQKTDHVICFGASGSEIAKQLQPYSHNFILSTVASLNDAVEAARIAALSSHKILLSPACASFDQFLNFEERGTVFKTLITNTRSLL